MKIINCTSEYSAQILEIFNDAILNSTALYDYKPWTKEIMETWFKTKMENNYPIIGIVNEENTLMGFGSYGTFRIRPAYKYTIENSLYVHKDFRGKGYGKILLSEIIKAATSQDFHSIIGVIDSSNFTSIELHKAFGFEPAGTLKQVGYKFGKWLDADFYELILDTPMQPKEDF